MKKAIFRYISKYEGVSFVELCNKIDGFSGDLALVNKDYDNIVFWNGLSEEAGEAINELLKQGLIVIRPTNILVYIIDGKVPQLPVAKKLRQYKTLKWLPVALYTTKSYKKQKGGTK